MGPRGLITSHLLGIKGFTVYGLHSTLFSETLTYFPIDDAFAGANRKRIVERWINEVLNPK